MPTADPQETRAQADRRGGRGHLLSAQGLAIGEIPAHLAEVYDADVSRLTIATVTDRGPAATADGKSTAGELSRRRSKL